MSAAKIFTGKRKTSIARVRLVPGSSGKVLVNKKEAKTYFGRESLLAHALAPIKSVERADKYEVHANISGGGLAGQSGALRLGIARALSELEPDLRKPIKKEGFLTRDARKVERKKYGLHKARKATQFSKR